MGTRQQHIVMFPFLAQGHIIPFLALAKLIDQRHGGRCSVTLVSTPLNVRKLRSSLPPDSDILLRELPFSGSDYGLPPDAENTDALPNQLIVRLLQASEALQPHFECLVSDIVNQEGGGGGPPLCIIIADVFFGWTVDVAKRLNMFHATFTTCGGYGTAAYFSLWLNLPHLGMDSDGEFEVPGFPETFRLHRSQLSASLRATDGSEPWTAFLRKQISHCLASGGMLCNTAEDMETTGTELLRKNTGLRVWAVGPLLLPKEEGGRAGRKPGIESENCIQWLDSHQPASVLYVSFGSQNTISPSQMIQLATGLEASGRPFIWVIRPPIGFDLEEEFRHEWLPEGFEDRTRNSGRGLLVRNWAPQLEILSHKSVGAFLSHCGWNSILESLSRGVPLIGWPLAAEQFYNSKMLEEELGVCVEMARGVEVNITGREVASAVKLVTGGTEKGEDMRKRAGRYSEMIRAAVSEEGEERGPSIKALDDFIETALGERDSREMVCC